MSKKILIALYSHPEAYPPTLNALTELAKSFGQISILYRPLLTTEWDYSEKVTLHPSGDAMSAREQESLPFLKRIKLFFNFILDFRRLCKKEKPDVVLLYDALPLMAYLWVRVLGLHKHLVWYHNHDVLNASQKLFSLNWWAYRAERKIFHKLNIFSLPSEERKQYFPMDRFTGKYFFLPNQPAVSFYTRYHSIKKETRTWRLIFQGHIDKGHGIEEILDLMPATVKGRPLKLILKGWVRDEYKSELLKLIRKGNLQNDVEFVGYTAYQELPRLTASCHIGIAIHTKTDIMNKTLGTASNKIYEYAAVGLPVLYYNNEHFTRHLGKYTWAVPTDVTAESLLSAIEKITDDYDSLSEAARLDFMNELNYENHFKKVEDYLDRQIGLTADKLIAIT